MEVLTVVTYFFNARVKKTELFFKRVGLIVRSTNPDSILLPSGGCHCTIFAANKPIQIEAVTYLETALYHIYSSKRHIRPLRTILFGGLGLGLMVGVLDVVRGWVRVTVSIRVRVGVRG